MEGNEAGPHPENPIVLDPEGITTEQERNRPRVLLGIPLRKSAEENKLKRLERLCEYCLNNKMRLPICSKCQDLWSGKIPETQEEPPLPVEPSEDPLSMAPGKLQLLRGKLKNKILLNKFKKKRLEIGLKPKSIIKNRDFISKNIKSISRGSIMKIPGRKPIINRLHTTILGEPKGNKKPNFLKGKQFGVLKTDALQTDVNTNNILSKQYSNNNPCVGQSPINLDESINEDLSNQVTKDDFAMSYEEIEKNLSSNVFPMYYKFEDYNEKNESDERIGINNVLEDGGDDNEEDLKKGHLLEAWKTMRKKPKGTTMKQIFPIRNNPEKSQIISNSNKFFDIPYAVLHNVKVPLKELCPIIHNHSLDRRRYINENNKIDTDESFVGSAANKENLDQEIKVDIIKHANTWEKLRKSKISTEVEEPRNYQVYLSTQKTPEEENVSKINSGNKQETESLDRHSGTQKFVKRLEKHLENANFFSNMTHRLSQEDKINLINKVLEEIGHKNHENSKISHNNDLQNELQYISIKPPSSDPETPTSLNFSNKENLQMSISNNGNQNLHIAHNKDIKSKPTNISLALKPKLNQTKIPLQNHNKTLNSHGVNTSLVDVSTSEIENNLNNIKENSNSESFKLNSQTASNKINPINAKRNSTENETLNTSHTNIQQPQKNNLLLNQNVIPLKKASVRISEPPLKNVMNQTVTENNFQNKTIHKRDVNLVDQILWNDLDNFKKEDKRNIGIEPPGYYKNDGRQHAPNINRFGFEQNGYESNPTNTYQPQAHTNHEIRFGLEQDGYNIQGKLNIEHPGFIDKRDPFNANQNNYNNQLEIGHHGPFISETQDQFDQNNYRHEDLNNIGFEPHKSFSNPETFDQSHYKDNNPHFRNADSYHSQFETNPSRVNIGNRQYDTVNNHPDFVLNQNGYNNNGANIKFAQNTHVKTQNTNEAEQHRDFQKLEQTNRQQSLVNILDKSVENPKKQHGHNQNQVKPQKEYVHLNGEPELTSLEEPKVKLPNRNASDILKQLKQAKPHKIFQNKSGGFLNIQKEKKEDHIVAEQYEENDQTDENHDFSKELELLRNQNQEQYKKDGREELLKKVFTHLNERKDPTSVEESKVSLPNQNASALLEKLQSQKIEYMLHKNKKIKNNNMYHSRYNNKKHKGAANKIMNLQNKTLDTRAINMANLQKYVDTNIPKEEIGKKEQKIMKNKDNKDNNEDGPPVQPKELIDEEEDNVTEKPAHIIKQLPTDPKKLNEQMCKNREFAKTNPHLCGEEKLEIEAPSIFKDIGKGIQHIATEEKKIITDKLVPEIQKDLADIKNVPKTVVQKLIPGVESNLKGLRSSTKSLHGEGGLFDKLLPGTTLKSLITDTYIDAKKAFTDIVKEGQDTVIDTFLSDLKPLKETVGQAHSVVDQQENDDNIEKLLEKANIKLDNNENEDIHKTVLEQTKQMEKIMKNPDLVKSILSELDKPAEESENSSQEEVDKQVLGVKKDPGIIKTQLDDFIQGNLKAGQKLKELLVKPKEIPKTNLLNTLSKKENEETQEGIKKPKSKFSIDQFETTNKNNQAVSQTVLNKNKDVIVKQSSSSYDSYENRLKQKLSDIIREPKNMGGLLMSRNLTEERISELRDEILQAINEPFIRYEMCQRYPDVDDKSSNLDDKQVLTQPEQTSNPENEGRQTENDVPTNSDTDALNDQEKGMEPLKEINKINTANDETPTLPTVTKNIHTPLKKSKRKPNKLTSKDQSQKARGASKEEFTLNEPTDNESFVSNNPKTDNKETEGESIIMQPNFDELEQDNKADDTNQNLNNSGQNIKTNDENIKNEDGNNNESNNEQTIAKIVNETNSVLGEKTPDAAVTESNDKSHTENVESNISGDTLKESNLIPADDKKIKDMYIVGNGINLPIILKQNPEGKLEIDFDLEKLCKEVCGANHTCYDHDPKYCSCPCHKNEQVIVGLPQEEQNQLNKTPDVVTPNKEPNHLVQSPQNERNNLAQIPNIELLQKQSNPEKENKEIQVIGYPVEVQKQSSQDEQNNLTKIPNVGLPQKGKNPGKESPSEAQKQLPQNPNVELPQETQNPIVEKQHNEEPKENMSQMVKEYNELYEYLKTLNEDELKQILQESRGNTNDELNIERSAERQGRHTSFHDNENAINNTEEPRANEEENQVTQPINNVVSFVANELLNEIQSNQFPCRNDDESKMKIFGSLLNWLGGNNLGLEN